VRCDALPVGDGWADAVFLLLTAHEIRKAEDRDQFFAEVARILSPGGRVVLVEHLRDTWNAVAFGPGFFHFFSRGEWLRTAARARLRVESERRMTPFVRVFVLGKLEGART
jgi:ubiquinone/menaquinone biosynthesis C-methylase UbiE